MLHLEHLFFIVHIVLIIFLIQSYNKITYKKQFITNSNIYFLINLMHSFCCTIFKQFRINNATWIEFIFMTSGPLLIYYQYYCFQKTIFFMTKKIISNYQKIIFFFITIIVFTRFFLKINNYIHHDPTATASTLLHSKLLFIAMIVIYVLFITMYIAPTIITIYKYIIDYQTRSPYFKTISVLLIIFIIKFFLEIIQSLFFDYFRFLLKNTYLFYISQQMQHDSDMIITFLAAYFSPILHIQFLLFLKSNHQVITRNFNYNEIFCNRTLPNHLIPITFDSLKNIFSEHYTIQKCIIDCIRREISKTCQCDYDTISIMTSENTDIAKNNIQQSEDSILTEHIKKNRVLYFDDIYDFNEAINIVETGNIECNYYKKLLEYCIKKKIKLAVFTKIEIAEIIIIEYNENTKSKYINQCTINKIITILDTIFYKYNEYNSFSDIKTKYEYLNHIEKYNFLEQKKKYTLAYQKIYTNFSNMENITFMDTIDKDGKILYPSIHEKPGLLIHQNIESLKNHKFQPIISHFTSNNQEFLAISNYNFTHNKKMYSNHLIIQNTTFVDKEIIHIFDQRNIELLFTLENKSIEQKFIHFYSHLQSKYNIKIIITETLQQPIIKNILDFILHDYSIENIFFKKNNFNKNTIKDFLEHIKQSKNTIFIIYNLFFLPIQIQNYFFYHYTQLFINQKNNNIKLFIIVSQEKNIRNISEEIISISHISHNPQYKIKELSYNDSLQIIYNMNVHIFKKNFNNELIENYLSKLYEIKKEMPLYQFIHYFFKIMNCKVLSQATKLEMQKLDYAIKMGKKSLKNTLLMAEIKRICRHNNTEIACLLEVNKSTIIRYYNKIK